MIAQAIKMQRLIEEDQRRLVDENTHLRQELRSATTSRTSSARAGRCGRCTSRWRRWPATNTTVLIRGESGTGKELIAHAIHYNSLRAKKPFVKVSCAALPDTLIESELFGHEKGAFTGAEAAEERAVRAGRRRHAVPRRDRRHQPRPPRSSCCACCRSASSSGWAAPRPSRRTSGCIAATNKDLEKAIAEGTFREDLYYRLNVFTIFVPPLRDRKADLLLLADHFLEKLSHEHGKIIKRISTPAIDMLMSYHWPGNVRELENVARARGAGLRRAGDSRAPPAADAADGGSVRHGDARLARTTRSRPTRKI